jgi:hypothetical protein
MSLLPDDNEEDEVYRITINDMSIDDLKDYIQLLEKCVKSIEMEPYMQEDGEPLYNLFTTICRKCHRRGFVKELGNTCNMPQPNGETCDGIFISISDEILNLEIQNARLKLSVKIRDGSNTHLYKRVRSFASLWKMEKKQNEQLHDKLSKVALKWNDIRNGLISERIKDDREFYSIGAYGHEIKSMNEILCRATKNGDKNDGNT